MCLKTHHHGRQIKESYLRKHFLYEMLICEIYNLLIFHRPESLSSFEIFKQLSPFLKARISIVMKQDQAIELFNNEQGIVEYIADLLADKLYKIHVENSFYHCEQETH